MTDADPQPDAPDPAARRAWYVWGLLVAAAVAVYELANQPAVIGVSLSLKFAIPDALTGLWLRRADPDRRRGAAHFWVYLGYGLGKAAMAGLALVFALSFLHGLLVGRANRGGNRPQPAHPVFEIIMGACGTSAATLLLSAAVTGVGLVIAWRVGARLWLHGAVAAARKRDDWPPDYGDRNRLESVTLPAALLAVGAVGGVAFGLLFAGLAAAGVPNPVLGFACLPVVLFVLPVGALRLHDVLKQRLAARDPADAWPDGPPVPARR